MRRILTVALVLTALLTVASVVWAAKDVMLDRVDLGSTGTEAGRTMEGWGRSATDETGGGYGGIGAGGCRLVLDPKDGDHEPVAYLMLEPTKGAAKGLKIRHLVGQADDSFALRVQHANGSWVDVGSYVDQLDGEQWIPSFFDISHLGFGRGRKAIWLEIRATNPGWGGLNSYGQLCIDWIEVYGNGKPR